MARKSKESDKTGAYVLDDPTRIACFGGAARQVRASWGLPDVTTKPPEPQERHVSRRVVAGLVTLGVAALLGAGALAYHFAYVVPNGVALDAAVFPDEALRKAVAGCDEDGNGRISPEEASHVTELDLSGLGIADLTGISTFAHLEKLDVSGNILKTADVSGCKALVELDVSQNGIESLDLAGLYDLQKLDVHDNAMQTLDLLDCESLTELDAAGNSLARLDLSGCPRMQRLNTDEGQEITLPLASTFFPDAGLQAALERCDADHDGALSARERQALYTLVVSDAATTSLEGLEWFENLTELDVSGTQVTSLDATCLPKSLTTLRAAGCALESVDVSGCTRLATLDLSGNPQLASVNLSALPRLTTANLANCNLTGALDVRANTRLEHLDVSGNASLEQVVAVGVAGLAKEGAVSADATCNVVLAEQAAEETGDAQAAEETQAAEGEAVQEEGAAEQA